MSFILAENKKSEFQESEKRFQHAQQTYQEIATDYTYLEQKIAQQTRESNTCADKHVCQHTISE